MSLKIKTFTKHEASFAAKESLDDKVNAFLDENPNIVIEAIEYTSHGASAESSFSMVHYWSVLILYREKPDLTRLPTSPV